VKPREAKHDAELYRVYQKEEDRIERRGGRVRRVLLDFELKKKVNRDLTGSASKRMTQTRSATLRNGTVCGSFMPAFPCPTCRSNTRCQTKHSASQFELTTEDYRPRLLADKARAGFTLYSHGDDASHVRRV